MVPYLNNRNENRKGYPFFTILPGYNTSPTEVGRIEDFLRESSIDGQSPVAYDVMSYRMRLKFDRYSEENARWLAKRAEGAQP